MGTGEKAENNLKKVLLIKLLFLSLPCVENDRLTYDILIFN